MPLTQTEVARLAEQHQRVAAMVSKSGLPALLAEHQRVAAMVSKSVLPALLAAQAGHVSVVASGMDDPPAVTLGSPLPSESAAPPTWRRDLLTAAVICFVVLSFHSRPFVDGLVETLRELCLIVIGALVVSQWWVED